MRVELHIVRRYGIKLPDREAAGMDPLRGDLRLCERWVSPTRALPALELTADCITNGRGLLAVLYEPKIVALGSNWMRFTGYEVHQLGDHKQLVIQDWRCLVSSN